MDGQLKTFSQAEVATHCKDGDCWIIINGKVYDVSPYMAKHPGGSDIIIANSEGKDASEAYEDADHTKRAREMLLKHYIGELAVWKHSTVLMKLKLLWNECIIEYLIAKPN